MWQQLVVHHAIKKLLVL